MKLPSPRFLLSLLVVVLLPGGLIFVALREVWRAGRKWRREAAVLRREREAEFVSDETLRRLRGL